MSCSNKKLSVIVFTFLYLISVVPGCTWSKTKKGGAIGAGAGGAIGGIIGSKSGHTVVGVILGAAVGGAAGAAIGRYMDKQAEELQRDLENAKVERIGEGIKITFDSDLLFDFDKSEIKAATKKNLEELARTLKKYPDTNILIEGHTDNIGKVEYNKELSERRAEAVAYYTASLGVGASRITKMGFGEDQPLASNKTSEGRQKNRRVDIAIIANEKLKKAAEQGEVTSN